MLGLKIIHVSKRGPESRESSFITSKSKPMYNGGKRDCTSNAKLSVLAYDFKLKCRMHFVFVYYMHVVCYDNRLIVFTLDSIRDFHNL